MKQTVLKLVRRAAAAAAFAVPLMLTPTLSSWAQSYDHMNCEQLWVTRNVIYAEKGYCFQSQRAIAVFGPRCYPPYGELNAREQREVDRIRAVERRKGCR